MSATELTNGDPVSAIIFDQVSLSIAGHTLHILFKETFDREETLLGVLNSINHKLSLDDIYMQNNVTDLSQSNHSQEIEANNLANVNVAKKKLKSLVINQSIEINQMITYKGKPGLKDLQIFHNFIHLIASNSEVLIKSTSPKEVLTIVIALIDKLKLESFDSFRSSLVDDVKQLMNTLGDDSIPMIPSLLFGLIGIFEHGQTEVRCPHEKDASKRGAGKLLMFLLTEHSRTIGPYLIHLECMVGRMLKTIDYPEIMFSKVYPKVLEAVKDRHGVKGTRELWSIFLVNAKIDAERMKIICMGPEFIDTLKSTIVCIGKEGITATEQKNIGKIMSIAVNTARKENYDRNTNEEVLRELASLAQETIKTFGQPFVTVFLPALPLLCSMIYSFKWSSEFIPYLMENALGIARDGQKIKTVLSCFRSTATNSIDFIRPHLITLITCCEKYLDHPSSDIRSESMEFLKRILSEEWIEEVMENLGKERMTTLCGKLLKAAEMEEEYADSLNTLIADVADFRMEANLKWYDLVFLVEEASKSNNNNLKKTAIIVLRRVPSLVMGEGETIANTIKDFLLECIQNGHYEEALNAFAVLAKESEANNDEWLMRSLSDMIPPLLTMANCALETGAYDVSDIEKAVDILVEMLPRTILHPYFHSILSLCKTALDTARCGQKGPVSKQLGVLAVTGARHIFTKMGSMMATAVTEPLCALGSHSIVVGDLIVEGDMESRHYASRSFKRLDSPKSSFQCVYSLFESIDKMKPTEASCLLLFLQSHGFTHNGEDIMIASAEGKHKCKGYKGMYCATKKNYGEAWPIYLTDVIFHLSQHLKDLDREENRGVKSVAIISPVICLVEAYVYREKRKYIFNKHSTDNVCLILNSDNGKRLTVYTRKDDPTRLVSLNTLANHKSIREGLVALKEKENRSHGKFRVCIDREWIHSRAGEEFVTDNVDTMNFRNFVMGKGTAEENKYLSTLFNTDGIDDEAINVDKDSSEEIANPTTISHSDTNILDSTQFNMLEDPSMIVSHLVEKLNNNDSKIRSNVLLELGLHLHRTDLSTIANLLPKVIGLIDSALKRSKDVTEVRQAFEILLILITRPVDNSYLPALLQLCQTTFESTWIYQGIEESRIRYCAATIARIVRDKISTIEAANVRTAHDHPADKSAYVPPSLSWSDVLSEDLSEVEIDLFDKTHSPFHSKEEKSAFVVASSNEEISIDDAIDNLIFGEWSDKSRAPASPSSTHTPDVATPMLFFFPIADRAHFVSEKSEKKDNVGVKDVKDKPEYEYDMNIRKKKYIRRIEYGMITKKFESVWIPRDAASSLYPSLHVLSANVDEVFSQTNSTFNHQKTDQSASVISTIEVDPDEADMDNHIFGELSEESRASASPPIVSTHTPDVTTPPQSPMPITVVKLASNDLSAHHADKSAFVPHSLSSSDVHSEDMEIDIFNQTHSPFQADKSAFVLSSTIEVNPHEADLDNRIFGELTESDPTSSLVQV